MTSELKEKDWKDFERVLRRNDGVIELVLFFFMFVGGLWWVLYWDG